MKLIRVMRKDRNAPVDSMGCDKLHSQQFPIEEQRFHILLALLLSPQTKDEMTSRAMANIIEKRLLIKDFSDISTISLKGLIKSVGFANKKAEYIKRVANIILNEYDGNVPDSLKELCSLPGVGNKIALLYLQTALNKCEGIAVDLHVHRIANRLEWTGCKNTKTPEQTRKKLEELIPKEDWNEINNYLVGFGQTICKSKPKCSSCLLQNTCPYRMRIDVLEDF